VSEIETNNDIPDGHMNDLSAELIRMQALSKSILELTPESPYVKNLNNTLQKIENISPVP